MSKPNQDKIFKELDKLEGEPLMVLVDKIKQFASAKLLAKSAEYSELAEKFQSLSESVNK